MTSYFDYRSFAGYIFRLLFRFLPSVSLYNKQKVHPYNIHTAMSLFHYHFVSTLNPRYTAYLPIVSHYLQKEIVDANFHGAILDMHATGHPSAQ